METVREVLLQEIGEEALFAFMRAYGGSQYYVPAAGPRYALLMQVVGESAAVRLGQLYGGRQIRVPGAVRDYLAERDTQIRVRRVRGDSANRLAEVYGLTIRRVLQIIKQS